MLAKKVTALLVSAALVLALLAGCGSRALSQVMADLLTGLYDNVSVEVDSDLTAALKKAAAEGGTEEEVLSALIENLNLSGSSITFTRLGSGQQGEHGVTVTFQAGSDPDAAARNALAQWASVFGSLPANGSYRAYVSMIEADNGYYIAVDVEVLKAGSHGGSDSDDDDVPEEGYIYAEANNTYQVYNEIGFKTVIKDYENANITLARDIPLTNWTSSIGSESNPYSGTLDGNGFTITIGGDSTASLVGSLEKESGNTGTIENLTLVVNSVDSGYYVGGLVNVNNGGTIQNCTVIINCDISATYGAGGLVGGNRNGTIQNCKVTINGDISTTGTPTATTSTPGGSGGVAGYNMDGTIENCIVTINGTIQSRYAGGVAGLSQFYNYTSTIKNCLVSGGTIDGNRSNSNDDYAGGIAGYIRGNSSVIACGHIGGTVTSSKTAGGVVGMRNTNSGYGITACFHAGGSGSVSVSSGSQCGGIVGYISGTNASIVTNCYWSGIEAGCGYDYNNIFANGNNQKVDNDWNDALAALLSQGGSGWELDSNGLPTLSIN